MSELIFLVEEAHEGGFIARALGQAIFTEADDLPSLRERIRDAARCHFEKERKPAAIRLRFAREDLGSFYVE
ncbi:MAG TPA: 2-oxoisovalerate dehydrogenase [Blastocatellia bacterium]|nr:2-oxoisovalerate dehydrogenase [Blastocatellia bacterium]